MAILLPWPPECWGYRFPEHYIIPPFKTLIIFILNTRPTLDITHQPVVTNHLCWDEPVWLRPRLGGLKAPPHLSEFPKSPCGGLRQLQDGDSHASTYSAETGVRETPRGGLREGCGCGDAGPIASELARAAGLSGFRSVRNGSKSCSLGGLCPSVHPARLSRVAWMRDPTPSPPRTQTSPACPFAASPVSFLSPFLETSLSAGPLLISHLPSHFLPFSPPVNNSFSTYHSMPEFQCEEKCFQDTQLTV